MGQRRNKKFIRFFLFVLLVLIILTVRFYEELGEDQKPGDRFYVVKVIDGDTVELTGGDKVRLLSIDTPEKGEPFYDSARTLLESLAIQKLATLTFQNNRRDRYGRILAYLYIDTLFVNKIIIEQGLGYLYLFRQTEKRLPETVELLATQRKAIDERRGIWSLSFSQEPYYIVKSGSFRLHRPGCYSVRELTEGKYRKIYNRFDAFYEGLSPCRNCKP